MYSYFHTIILQSHVQGDQHGRDVYEDCSPAGRNRLCGSKYNHCIYHSWGAGHTGFQLHEGAACEAVGVEAFHNVLKVWESGLAESYMHVSLLEGVGCT